MERVFVQFTVRVGDNVIRYKLRSISSFDLRGGKANSWGTASVSNSNETAANLVEVEVVLRVSSDEEPESVLLGDIEIETAQDNVKPTSIIFEKADCEHD